MRVPGILLAIGAAALLAGCSSTSSNLSYSSAGHPYGVSHQHRATVDHDGWQRDGGNRYGKAQTIRQYQAANGRWCRDYNQTIHVHGEPYVAHGTACMDKHGAWRPIWSQF